MLRRELLCLAGLLLISLSAGNAGIISRYSVNTVKRSGPVGNGVTDIFREGDYLWLGTGNGLSRFTFSTNEFESYENAENLIDEGISALYVKGDTLLVAAGIDTFIKAIDATVDWGKGLSFSSDNGETWKYIEQPGETPGQNVVWDFTLQNGVIWAASFGGGLLKSTDFGETWQVETPDSLVFDPVHVLNHLPFSVLSTGDALWVGTSGGINKSMDGGHTWEKFTFSNQQEHISGNWVVNIAHQKDADHEAIWACTWKAEGMDETYAVSRTDDGGRTWDILLQGERAYDIAFDGPNVYVATWTSGLWKSPDYGETWYNFQNIRDRQSSTRLFTNEFYSVYASNDSLWVGTLDGLAFTENNGYTWTLYRAFRSTRLDGEPRTYAYPNPFSSTRDNVLGETGHVRIQYNTTDAAEVTVKVYDFAMDLVTTVCDGKYRAGGGDYSEVWNGSNDYGDTVANGVYFYSVEISGDGAYWGKIMVVN
ncbi:MAG: FlgD immunoglobulin-like domain containing protein [candidate division KSB1 bacterium]|nr:FlgD immunoglobulin-like domain containing protein [candidate division KSB1 bacterium]